MKRVHFVGIGGSGLSGVAYLAHSRGYKVTGCDLLETTPYIDKLKKLDIPIFVGHSPKHLENVDILATTPAAFFQSEKHPELLRAKKEKNLMTWQNFLGKYLHKDKKVICIAGTHGKSTTTAMASLLFESVGLDPWSMIGATVNEWGSNARVGKSDLFITEADEFYDNFLSYRPEIIVLNNIEFDHPDYFETEEQLLQSFAKHVKSLTGKKVLIFNQDSVEINKLFALIGDDFLNKLSLIGYTLGKPAIKTKSSLIASDLDFGVKGTSFKVKSIEYNLCDSFSIKLSGAYNVENSLAVIALAKYFGIPTNQIRKSLVQYDGIGRRMELIGTKKMVRVYDDYAHHPTAIKVTLQGLRQKYPRKTIWAVIEPHTFSRTKALLNQYKKIFDSADKVIVAPIFKSRDKNTYGVSSESIVKIANHKDIKSAGSFDEVTALIKERIKKGDVVVTMGAGKSHELSRRILRSL